MTITPEVINVVEEEGGRFTADVRVTNDGHVIARAQVTATSKADFKDKIRPRLQRLLENEARRQQLIAAAEAAINELITELGF